DVCSQRVIHRDGQCVRDGEGACGPRHQFQCPGRICRSGVDALGSAELMNVQAYCERCTAGCLAGCMELWMLLAVLMSARCVRACGKLPVWRRRIGSYCSENSPTSLATLATRSNSSRALATLPSMTCASAS